MESPNVSQIESRGLKWVCMTCGAEYAAQQDRCDDDGTELSAVKSESLVGTILAEKYFLESLIGRGGMSSIYKAKQILMDKYFAVKLMHVFLMSDSTNIRRFQVESKAAASLNHPNLISVQDFGITPDGIPYLVMDFIDGKTLQDILDEEDSMGVEYCLDVMRQVMAGLAHIHENGIVHRDLKPSNVMISKNSDGSELVRIVDFGIAKVLDEGKTALTLTGEVLGSPPYMSPEQCQGKPLDARSDIYALACMMYQCLSGKLPVMGKNLLETFTMQITYIPKPLSEVVPHAKIPVLVEDAVLKGLEKDPQHRFQSVAEFRKRLFEGYEKAREQEALQYLAARLNSRFRRFRQRINQNAALLGLLSFLLIATGGSLLVFNPTCRQFTHSAVTQSIYSTCMDAGRLMGLWNFEAGKWFLDRAVREADFGKVADNRINSRDALQNLYDRYGYRVDAKRVDSQIKEIKSQWLVNRFNIKMRDEDQVSASLLDVMQIPSDKAQARTMANSLTELAEKSLKRGAYALAERQAARAASIYSDELHERTSQSMRALNALCTSLELNGRLTEASLQAEALLKQSQIVPIDKEFECSAELELARIALIEKKMSEAESKFKQAIETAGGGFNQDLKNVRSPAEEHRAAVLVDALNDYAALLRRSQRADEAQKVESRLTSLESKTSGSHDRALR